MKTLNKLVRDKMPEKIKEDGLTPKIEYMGDSDYQNALRKKIMEEACELLMTEEKADILEESADLIEVLRAFWVANGIDWVDVESTRAAKFKDRGGFDKKILLKEIM